ncbi:short-chain dehydrogenase/reductase SDR [Fibrella aestuarina BUZ 2]|uniref:Short-chain dehydrogenase/reductase SDR n=1 Tax=Fibrella aestuarina BUZ 2 TaxID=1166018 RepID=I0KEY0_9BACT|nr:oxidoreductase [Fibrella aestuarina]CCH02683.1 short-chain dehydrogenase/reductase SDR [Fibrella aestuarina BUZ 2]
MTNQSQQQIQVWFITGASKGFGLELVHQLIQQGHRVAATSRDGAELRRAAGIESADFLPMTVDLITEASVAEAIQATIAHFGRIDVVVNNAGYGQVGALEELTDEEARANFEVNVFGTLNVIRQVMPQLRKQQSGHILNLSSIAGISGAFPGWGIYCATKFAVEGLSESLAAEAAPFGIKVTIVEPGYFRTEFLASGSLRTAGDKLSDYTQVRESEEAHQSQIRGNQPGDPVKAVAAMIQIAGEANPPLHLLLGRDAYAVTEAKITSLQADMTTWKTLTQSTDFTEPAMA